MGKGLVHHESDLLQNKGIIGCIFLVYDAKYCAGFGDFLDGENAV